MWILVMLFLSGSGSITPQVLYFGDKPACESAMRQIGSGLGHMSRIQGLTVYMNCLPSKSEGDSPQKSEGDSPPK